MGQSVAKQIVSILVLSIVLVHLSPLAMGILLCIGDGTDPDCCNKPGASQIFTEDTQQLPGADCDCCIAVGATPSTIGTASHKASVDACYPSSLSPNVVSSAAVRFSHPDNDDCGSPFLATLRTMVLLI